VQGVLITLEPDSLSEFLNVAFVVNRTYLLAMQVLVPLFWLYCRPQPLQWFFSFSFRRQHFRNDFEKIDEMGTSVHYESLQQLWVHDAQWEAEISQKDA
jgi:hypothetical protein